MLRFVPVAFICFLQLIPGCASFHENIATPSFYRYDRDGLIFHTDAPIDSQLITRVSSFRTRLKTFVALEQAPSVEVYLFQNRRQLSRYVQESKPHYPNRRAFYVFSEGKHRIYAFNDRDIEADLRHELTHAFLQAHPTEFPLWLDEGLAEYFEASEQEGQINRTHVGHLRERIKRGRWLPQLKRLMKKSDPLSFDQTDYSESWLWIHREFSRSKKPENVIELLSRFRDQKLEHASGNYSRQQQRDRDLIRHLSQLD